MSSTATSPGKHPAASTRDLGVAWVLLCVATAAHVTDEALTGFLSVYNPTVVALRAKLGFWPRPTFEFRDWLTGLILAVIIRLALSPLVFGGSRRILPFFHFFAIVMLLHGLGHAAEPSSAPDRKFDSLSAANAGLLLLSAALSCSHLRSRAIEKNEACECLIAPAVSIRNSAAVITLTGQM
jgi:hypothetical protein